MKNLSTLNKLTMTKWRTLPECLRGKMSKPYLTWGFNCSRTREYFMNKAGRVPQADKYMWE